MKPGQIVDEFTVKKGGEKLRVVFRVPKAGDARAMVKMVNSVRDEAQYLGMWHHETVKSERKYLSARLQDLRKDRGVFLLVEVHGQLVGNSVIRPLERDSSKHIGTFGIMLKEEFTGIGIGTRLARKTLSLAKKETRFKLIQSNFVSKNKRSYRLHKKLGFKRYGKFPNSNRSKDGTYYDKIYVFKEIKKI